MDDATFKRAIYTELESVQRIREEFEKKAGQRAVRAGVRHLGITGPAWFRTRQSVVPGSRKTVPGGSCR